MAVTLKKQKKKVILKNVKEFESIRDILADRETKTKKEEEKEFLERKEVLGEDFFNQREDIKGFQKKVKFNNKVCFEDLMQEEDLIHDSDDNEEIVLDRL